MDLGESLEDEQKFVIYKYDDLFSESFPLMKEIRRLGKLTDVTLKVNYINVIKYLNIVYTCTILIRSKIRHFQLTG